MKAVDFQLLAFGALAAAGVIWLLSRKGVATSIGRTVGQAAGETATGVVVGLGAAVGVPETNPDKCAAAKAAGDGLEASFQCPAGDFLKWQWGRVFG